MKIVERGNVLEVTPEPGDRKPKNEPQLFYWLRDYYRAQGRDFIKRPMWKDGHMVADTQHYIRDRLPMTRAQREQFGAPIAIYDGRYALRDAAEDFRNGATVRLAIVRNFDIT